MTWALRRQIFYVVVLILFFSTLGYLIIRPSLNKAPTCTDSKQNGTETGVDCGGACARACINQVDKISLLWARSFRVVPGRYNAVAYLVNHNENTAINKINYRFRFADKDNIYIGKRDGSTYIPPSGAFTIFEPAIDVGYSVPIYTSFEFTQAPEWITVSKDKIDQIKVLVSNIKLVDAEIAPRLSATVKNTSLFSIPDVNLTALLYDESGNAVSVSHTYLDVLKPEETKDISFTWPEPFESKVVAKEIIPMFNIFLVKLK